LYQESKHDLFVIYIASARFNTPKEILPIDLSQASRDVESRRGKIDYKFVDMSSIIDAMLLYTSRFFNRKTAA